MAAEYRWEPVSGIWTLLSSARAARPFEYARQEAAEPQLLRCPFCRGNEAETPASVLDLQLADLPVASGSWPARDELAGSQHRDEDADSAPPVGSAAAGPWDVRVVPNLYPALDRTAPAEPLSPDAPAQPGYGFHEVVIETPHHAAGQLASAVCRMELALLAYQLRTTWLVQQPHIQAVQVFRNCGMEAGASLSHLHSQLIALPGIPRLQQQELEAADQWYQQRGSCLFCDLVLEAELDGQRIVCQNAEAVAYCPFASRTPFEVWIQPRVHQPYLTAMTPTERHGIAKVLHQTLCSLESELPGVAYNLWCHFAPGNPQDRQKNPFDSNPQDHYHWHIELYPRVSKGAGFELGSGWAINWLDPVEAAERLRGRL